MVTHYVPLPWTNNPIGLNDRDHHHVHAKKVKKALAEAREAIEAAGLPRLDRITFELHLQLATRHRRDADNLAGTLKVCQDALVAAGAIEDDGWSHIPRSGQEIHGPMTDVPAAMWLEIVELDDAPRNK